MPARDGGNKWTQPEVNRLRSWWVMYGHLKVRARVRRLANQLGRTVQSVQSKALYEGLSLRPSKKQSSPGSGDID